MTGWVALARAIRQRRSVGRARRLVDKLDRVIDDAEALLAEVGGDGDLSLCEKRTIAICHRLGDEFTQDELEDAIAAGPGGSPPTLRRYTDRVLKHLDVVEHPRKAGLYVPETFPGGLEPPPTHTPLIGSPTTT